MLSQSLARTKPGKNNRNAAANRLALFEPTALAQEKQRRLILPGEMGHVRALEINLRRAPGGADFEHREFAQPIEKDHATSAATVGFVLSFATRHGSLYQAGLDWETRNLSAALYPVSDGARRGQSCIFFESVLAKKVRTDPAPAVTDPLLGIYDFASQTPR